MFLNIYTILISRAMQNLTVRQIQNKTSFSGNKKSVGGNLSIFTEPEVRTQEEKQRNSTIKKALGIAGGVALVGLLLSPKFIPQSAKKKIMQKVRNLENQKLKEVTTKGLDYTKNIGINFTGVKDNFMKKVTEMKFIGKPYEAFSDWTTKLFKKGGLKTAKRIGAKPVKSFEHLTKNIDKLKGKLDASKLGKEIEIDGVVKTIGDWLDDVTKLSTQNADDFAEKFNSDEIDKIVKSLDGIFEDISPKYRENVISRLKNGNWQDFYKVPIYDEMYNSKDHTEKITELVKKSVDNNSEIKNILGAIKDSGALSKRDSFFVNHVFKNAEKNTTKCKNFLSIDLFEKLRELAGGNAPTDLIFTAGVPLAGYLVAHNRAKTKEDKVSLACTAGIPLGLGISGMIYSTFNMVAGWKALLIGGAITMISSIAGKTADKIYRKNNNLGESTLPTLNLPESIENSGLAKTIESGVENYLDPEAK